MNRRRPAAVPAVLCLVVLCLAVLSGCVSVPSTGPTTRIEGPAPPCQNCVNVEVQPPAVGDEPKAIVEGYLRATSVYQPNYSVAKQFLTKVAAQRWSPEDGAQIYSGSPVAVGTGTVVLDGKLEGALGPDRTYTAQHRPLKWNFGLVREAGGQWRISRPPPGLMIADYKFARFYSSYNIYFVGNGSTLVPDPIYLPNLPDQANTASVLMKALLAGPSKWLQPAVTSALPVSTELSVDSVTLENGIAQVPLSDAVLALNDSQRSLLAAQVVYTLQQAPEVKGVLFKVNTVPFRVPQSDQDSQVVPVERISPEFDPVPFIAGNQLYAVHGKSVQVVDLNADSPKPRPMPVPLGQGKYAVDSLAVYVANTDVAVVTDHRTVLRAGLTTTGDVTTKLNHVSNLLRPQYSRYRELWAVGEAGGRQRMWTFVGDKLTEVGAPMLAAGTVTAFKISPDGTRMALIRRIGKASVLGLARINRSDKITVDGWRPLDTTQANAPGLTVVKDVAWLDATQLLVLGAPTPQATVLPYQISQDASVITPPSEPNIRDAAEVTALLGGAQTSVIIGRTGRTYKDDGTQWAPFLNGYSTMAFPG